MTSSTAMLAAAAHAQSAAPGATNGGSGAVARSGFVQVFDRLDSLGIALVVGAAIVLALLVYRIFAMVRREQPVRTAAPLRQRPKSRAEDDLLERSTMSRPTDWGSDHNRRASPARTTTPTPLEKAAAELPSLESTVVTQWSIANPPMRTTDVDAATDGAGAQASPYRTAFNPYFRGDVPGGGAMEVIEVADTLLQAELLVQLGDPKQAMTLLANHIRETEKPGPAVWLMLLDLYQSTGRKSQYEALAIGFGTLFNAQVPPWASTREDASRDIESYPQVMARLQTTWSKPTVRPFVEGLLNDDRGGSRLGFTLTAYRDLLFLVEILDHVERIAAEEAEHEGIQRKLGRIA